MVICLLLLTDVEDGGGTSFPFLGMGIGAKKGWMLQFGQYGQSLEHSAWWYARSEGREMGL